MASADVINGGNVEPRALEEEMRTAYLDYAMSVIVGRALPDVRDGLKPVHRRVLYAMNELGLGPTRSYAKSAKIVGEVMGSLSPARRLGDLRHARAHGTGLLHALRTRRRPGQLQLDRRRPGSGHALLRQWPDARVHVPEGPFRIEDRSLMDWARDSRRAVDLTVLDRAGRPVRFRVFHSEHPTRVADGRWPPPGGLRNHPVLCIVELAGVPLFLAATRERSDPVSVL